MDERPANGVQRLMWSRGIAWGVASAATYVVLVWIVAFALGEHTEDGATIIGFGIFTGLINGVMCGDLFVAMPPTSLKLRHWVAVAVIAAACGYGSTALPGSLPKSSCFAAGFVIVGLPLGYFLLERWASRPRAPKGHPDNIPS